MNDATPSAAALAGELTRLDERVLRAVASCRPPKTSAAVVREMYPVTTRSSGAMPEQAREVVEILHGLECAECVHELDGVWHLGSNSAVAKAKSRR